MVINIKKLVFIMVFIFLCGCTLQENKEENDVENKEEL